MKHSWITGLWLLGTVTTLTSCGFDGDELREYLPPEVVDAPSIYNERDIFVCAVSIYQLANDTQNANVPFSRPNRSTTDWLQLPVEGKVDDGSFAARAIFDGNECFDREAQDIIGLRKLSEYYSSEQQGFFIEVHYDLILVHDTERNLIIISSSAS